MVRIVNVIITSSDEGKGAYGLTVDTAEVVYFSAGAAEVLNLVEFDEVQAIVVPNNRENPPLFAQKARRI